MGESRRKVVRMIILPDYWLGILFIRSYAPHLKAGVLIMERTIANQETNKSERAGTAGLALPARQADMLFSLPSRGAHATISRHPSRARCQPGGFPAHHSG